MKHHPTGPSSETAPEAATPTHEQTVDGVALDVGIRLRTELDVPDELRDKPGGVYEGRVGRWSEQPETD